MQEVKNFYDKNSERYEEFEAEALLNYGKYPLLFAIRNRERNLVSKAVKKKVLFFAAGSGYDILHLANLGNKIVTIDFSMGMIDKTMKRLEKADVEFELLNEGKELTEEFLNDFFADEKKQVMIINADISKISFPEDYFDYAFCYCTLPHLGKSIENTLKKLLSSSKNGAVSVYEKENLPYLSSYYNDFGFKAKVEDRTITIQDGFLYYCIPPEEVKRIIEEKRKLEIVHIGLGNIFVWTPKN